MKLRTILLSLLGIIIIVLNTIYGNAISLFLSICITGSIIYYLLVMFFERSIIGQVRQAGSNPASLAKAAQLSKRYRSLFNFILLTAIFISSIICIRNTAMPRNQTPYFYNNEYHAISNSGILFSSSLPLYTREDAENKGKLTLSNSGSSVALRSENFYTPVFAESGEKGDWKLVNKIFDKKIKDRFSFSNGHTSVSFTIEKQHGFFRKLLGRSPKAFYTVQIATNQSELAGGNIKDTFSFRGPFLKEGMSLYNLMFQQEITDAPRSESMQVLQDLMQTIGKCYLIADHEDNNEGYYFFPERSFFENGFTFSADGIPVSPETTNSASVPVGKFFYIGFHNAREKMKVEQTGKTMALTFDHPPMYRLNTPTEEQHLNNKSQVFLTNDFDQVIDSKANEGFYFNNFGLMTDANFEGRMGFVIGKATDKLAFSIQDLQASKVIGNESYHFTLHTDNPGIQYQFQIRDFSDNGFSFGKMLLYATLIYLGILIVLIFFPGKDQWRTEAVIFVVIYALFIIRMIMYWRLATFPPLENISKHELESTILNFDFNFGIQLPVPLTIIWIYLFLILLVIFRNYREQISSYVHRFTGKYITGSGRSINKSYLLLMTAVMTINIINSKILGIEMLTRVLAIIVPLTLYVIFSIISNKHFTLDQKWAKASDSKFITEAKAYFYYLVNNPAFVISMVTLAYFALTDRGFVVLFVLFLILKNILLNFLKKPYNSDRYSFWKMISKPNNYWVYGIVALIIYFLILSVKSFFYYVLQYYMILIGIALLLLFVFFYFFFREKKRLLQITGGALLLYAIIVAIPLSRNAMDHAVREEIKHVQYRISIINQPISELLLQNEYSSFSTKKIIETAENQWFINSYISKEYNTDRTINLRPYNRVGVNYNTQTRDVVLARFVIGEMGNITMYLLLVLCILPLILYLISYKFTEDDGCYEKVHVKTYPGVIPLIIFFTICLFVWLTSTNRFVFFGQDFPFLSLTSKTSVVLPLLLFGITLVQRPKSKSSEEVNLQSSFTRYALFIGMIVFFALATVQSNTLSSTNFSVVVDKTQRAIDQRLNAIMVTVQDSISVKKPSFTYSDMISAMKEDKQFKAFLNEELDDPYTRSIVSGLVNNPYSAFQVSSPLYIQYDGYRYAALYNQHFYLELPAVENREVWHGSIVEMPQKNTGEITLTYNNEQSAIRVPYFKNDAANHIQLAVLPQSWLAGSEENVAIVDVGKSTSPSTRLSIFKDAKNTFVQRSTSFASSVTSSDLAAVEAGNNRFTFSFEDRSRLYAVNKWINGKYRILYPQRPRNLWIRHFAGSIKSVFDERQQYRERYALSIDFSLNKKVEDIIHTACAPNKKNNKYKFSVITADGDGHIRLMQDYVSNRKSIDPNDNYTINQMKQEQFFFSNIRNERDQWGESNMLNMQLGPGSSIKPLIAGIVTSQVNAGWQNLVLRAPNQSEYNYYAGFRLVKPWKNDDHYIADLSLDKYIEASSNFYQSVMMFLGSYPKDAFMKDGKASLAHVLTGQGGKNNAYPSFSFNGMSMFFPNYNGNKDQWPVTDYGKKKGNRYFGNENSLLANGLEVNGNLITKEKNKNEIIAGAYDRINTIDSSSYALLKRIGSSDYLWSMPEESSFMQSLRSPAEIHQNFNIGLKTATLGGYPYQLSPYKMLEMYGSMFTQNRAFRLHLDTRKLNRVPWFVDSTWNGNTAYNEFLAQNIFKGMSNVIYGPAGTAHRLGGLKAKNSSLHYYAKTGTINEQGSGARSSRRLVVAISDKDLQQSTNIGNAKVYLIYFMVDRNQDFDWNLLNQIITETMNSSSFKNYFGDNKTANEKESV